MPAGWVLDEPINTDLWRAHGKVNGLPAGCFVRISTIPGLSDVSIDEFFSHTDNFYSTDAIGEIIKDAEVSLYKYSSLGGRPAREIIYTRNIDKTNILNLSFQTLDGDNIVTVNCFTLSTSFDKIAKQLEEIISSFRFLD